LNRISRSTEILLLAGAAGACGGDRPGSIAAGTDLTGRVDLCAPTAWSVEQGHAEGGRHAWITRWYGRESQADAPLLLGDERPGLIVSTPSRLRRACAASAGPRALRVGVRRDGPGEGPAVRAEVFWKPEGGEPRSLAASELPAEEDAWRELAAEVPAAAGDLWLVAHFTHPGLASQPGPRVTWGAPILAPAQPPHLPDIVIVTVDTLRADALQYMPVTRRYFAEGEWAEAALAPSNWTLPAFASLWTGLPADRHGAGRGAVAAQPVPGAERRGFTALGPAPTFVAALHAVGWATACVHQNPFLEPWTGLSRDFEAWIRTRDAVDAQRGPALGWWRANAHRPRLLVLHWMTPHLPYGEDDTSDPLHALDWRNFLQGDRSPAERRAFFDLPEEQRARVRERYYEEARRLDAELAYWLGEFLTGARRPAVLFFADHGEELWDAGSFEHGHTFDASVVRVPAGLRGAGGDAGAGTALPGARPAGHAGLHLLHRLAESDARLAQSLQEAIGALPRCGFAPGCPAGSEPARALRPLYRSEHDGVEIRAGAEPEFIPYSGSGSGGLAPDLPADVARRLAELGYAGGG